MSEVTKLYILLAVTILWGFVGIMVGMMYM